MVKLTVFIFDNEKDFQKAIAELEQHHEPKPLIYLKHYLNSYADVRKQIKLLDDLDFNCFQGFQRDKLIKVVVTAPDGVKYNITYVFNNRQHTGCYSLFHKYCRTRENIYL